MKLIAVDALRHSLVAREAAGWLLLVRGLFSLKRCNRAAHLARAIGFASSDVLLELCMNGLRQSPGIDGAPRVWQEVVQGLPRYRTLVRDQPRLDRSIVLKAPGADGERGVLLMTFEYNWARLLLGVSDSQMAWLDERYDLVLSASWSPTDYAVLALALSRVTGTIFVQSCNYDEIRTIERFHPRLKCLPTLPCDWINPAHYDAKPTASRSTDIVMVANWGEFKRHWELFRALAQMPPQLRVVLIGQPEAGRTVDTMRQLARDFGVPQDLEFVQGVPIAEVARRQCEARVSVIMTRREGCCVAAVESLFAGCALAMRSDAHVGPMEYINNETGARLRPGHVAEDLMRLLAECPRQNPRGWADRHVAGTVSHGRVNAMLAAQSHSRGLPWTVDIVLPQWRPHPTFARPEDQERMRPAYQELISVMPEVVGKELLNESWR